MLLRFWSYCLLWNFVHVNIIAMFSEQDRFHLNVMPSFNAVLFVLVTGSFKYSWCAKNFLPPTKEKACVFARVHLSVCEQDYSKRHAWIWMKCCVSTDVWTWTNWLIFWARSGLYSGCRNRIAFSDIMCCNAEFYYVGKIPPIGISLQWRVVLKWFYGPTLQRRVDNAIIHHELSEQLCRRYMRSTKCPSSLFCCYLIFRLQFLLMLRWPCTWSPG